MICYSIKLPLSLHYTTKVSIKVPIIDIIKFNKSFKNNTILKYMEALQGHILLRRSALVGLSNDEANQLVPNLISVMIDGLKPT